MGTLARLKAAHSIMGSNVLPFPADSSRTGIASPWTEGALTQFVWSDIYGSEYNPVDRAEAMSLPAVANARSRIITELAGRPLRAVKNGALVTRQPAWLYRTSSDVSPYHRMLWTLDDHYFYGDSLWICARGAANQIIDAIRCPRNLWRVSEDGVIEVRSRPSLEDWRAAKKSEVIYLPAAHEGILNIAADTIRANKNLESSWANQAATPMPSLLLKQKESGQLDVDEVKKVVEQAAAARRDPNGAVMFVPFEYDAEFAPASDGNLLIEGRNAAKLDIASFSAIDASAIDAALPKASLNYETQDGTAASVKSRMSFWSQPLEARLSMDDIVPAGTAVAFDFSDRPDAPGGDTGPYEED